MASSKQPSAVPPRSTLDEAAPDQLDVDQTAPTVAIGAAPDARPSPESSSALETETVEPRRQERSAGSRAPDDLAPDPTLTYDPLRSSLRQLEASSFDAPTEASPPSPSTSAQQIFPEPAADTCEVRAFELVEPLAQGGFGEVWRGIQRDLGREIAVKTLRDDRLQLASPEQRQLMELQFRQEALTTARLEHPNIVPVYQLASTADNRTLLGLKMVRGRPWNELIHEDLDRLSDDQPLGDFLQRHLAILLDVAQAVAFAHSRGILHRDLKPHQVMVGEFGEVQLMDWGIASPFGDARTQIAGGAANGSADDSASAVSGSYGPAGTPSFMAPEQTYDDPGALGPWTDLYLLGGILYYLLTGTSPHRARNSLAAFLEAAREDVLPPEIRTPGRRVPQELSDLAMGVLQRDSEAREPATVEGFIAALEAYQSGAAQKRRSRQITHELQESRAPDYAALNQALSRVQEAEALWPDNPTVPDLRRRYLTTYTEMALAQQDLTLARVQADQLPAGRERQTFLQQVDDAERRQRTLSRQRRLALAGLVVLAVVLLAGGWRYLHDQRLGAERLRQQRDAARVARAEAEGLMTFMLEDLWERLVDIERVDVMESVARRAGEYYAERNPAELSPEERANRGAAFSTIGQTLFFQGEMEEAQAVYQQAADTFRKLSEEQPEEPQHVVNYLSALDEVARTRSDQGDKTGALETYTRVRKLCEEALNQQPDNLDVRFILLSTIDGTGIVHYDLGQMDEARASFTEALALAQDLGRRSPDLAAAPLAAGTAYRLAVTLLETGQPEKALQHATQAVELMGDASQQRGSLTNLALAEAIRAQILTALGRAAEGARRLRALEPRIQAQIVDDPDNAETRYTTAVLLLELAKCELQLGNTAAARSAWLRVIEVVEPVRERVDHAYLLDSLVRALLRLGRVEEARPVAADLLAKGWTHQGFEELCREFGIWRAPIPPVPTSPS